MLLILAAAGCQNDTKIASNQPEAGSATASSEPDASKAPVEADAPSNQPTAPAQPDKPITTPPPKTNEVVIPNKDLPPGLRRDLDAASRSLKQAMAAKLVIPATNTADWRPYTRMPVGEAAPKIAQQIEKALGNLHDTFGKISIAYQSPDGTGSFDQELKVRDRTEFKVPFIVVGAAPLTCNVFTNGKLKLVQYGPEWRDKGSLSSPVKAYTPLAAPQTTWQRDFTQMIYEPMTRSPLSWPSVVDGWIRGDQGYVLSVDDRDIPLVKTDPKTGQSKTYHYADFRFHAERGEAAAAKYGKSEIEVVVDAYLWLPKTIRSIYTDKSGKKTWKITWTCTYNFHRKFKDTDFLAPYTSKLKKA